MCELREKKREVISPQIIFEDTTFLVIDKPSGMVVNWAETTGKNETLQDWVESKYQIKDKRYEIKEGEKEKGDEIKAEFLARSGIVHRLDKDTSGLLVIAKTPEAFERLKEQFKSRTVIKKYLALVHGKVEPPEGSINAPIERNPFNRMHFGIFPGGREAVTQYRTYKTYRTYTLLEITPHAGRTHQIRVHMKYINHPIVSDPIYGGRKNLQADLQFCPRLFLHAASLLIKHPETEESQEFSSPLPSDLEGVLKLLK